MGCTPYRWKPDDAEAKARILSALRANPTRSAAAKAAGITLGSLDHGCEVYGIDKRAELGRSTTERPKVDQEPPLVEVPPPAPLDWTGARPPRSANGYEIRLNIGDVHIPAHLATALGCVYNLIRAIQPHKVYQLGDLLNAQAFSHHAATSPKAERVDLASAMARGFVRNVKRAAPGAKLVIVKGNHCGWAERWEAENPAFEGSFDFETMLGLKRAEDDDAPPMFEGVEVVKHAEESGYVDGPIAYCHGTGGGLYAARRYAENVGPRAGVRHVRFAHHHTNQVYCHKNGIQARCVGWLGNEHHESNAFRYAPPPRGWWVGVTRDDVFGDHVTTTDYAIVNGTIFVGGHLIAA